MTADPSPRSRHLRRLAVRFGADIRRVRKDRGLTATRVAADLGIHPARLSRVESGTATLEPFEIDRLLDVLGAGPDDRQAILRTTAEINSDMVVIAMDPVAPELTEGQNRLWNEVGDVWRWQVYAPNVVAGFVQTLDYARSIFSHHPMPGVIVEDDVIGALRERMQAQSMLYSPERQFDLLIGESALVHSAASLPVLAAQCHHLAQVSTLPTVRLGIIPLAVRLPFHLLTGFNLADDCRLLVDMNWAYVEITSPAAIEVHRLSFEATKAVALYDDEARAFLLDLSRRLLDRAGADGAAVDLRSASGSDVARQALKRPANG